jgi:DNA helicase II / ATP-dependent DNA helicase PcrA
VPSSLDLSDARREVRFWRCADERAQAFSVAADIERLIGASNVQPRRIAVLVHSMESDSRPLAGALRERAIPHRLLGRAALFERAEVRDVLAWLRLLLDPGDAGAVVRALVRPPIELRQVDVARVVQVARRRKLDMVAAAGASIELAHIPPEACERIARFLQLQRACSAALAQLAAEPFLDRLIETIDLRADNPLATPTDGAERLASVDALQGLAASFIDTTPACDARALAAHLIASARTAPDAPPQDDQDPATALPRAPGASLGSDDLPPGVSLGAEDVHPGASLAREEPPRGASPAAEDAHPGAVQVMGLSSTSGRQFDHVYLVGLHAAQPVHGGDAGAAGEGSGAAGEGSGAAGENPLPSDEAIIDAAHNARDRLVLAYPAASSDGKPRAPAPLVEDARLALGAEWEDRVAQQPASKDSLRAAIQAMRKELLDGVARVGGRLGELRLDTDLDISHGVVRYLELVKLVALLERPEGEDLGEALADLNARLLAAATPLQREILETSTLDQMLLAAHDSRTPGLGPGAGGPGLHGGLLGLSGPGRLLGSIAREERSLESFLPRKGDGLLLSASDLETYRSCPLRYKFARVLRIPSEPTLNQRFGIVVHQVLERYHASGVQTEGLLMELLEQSWRRAGLGASEHERFLFDKARESLMRYHEELGAHDAEPVWFERSFTFELGPHRVRGRVDRIDRLPDGSFELIDYKTGRAKDESQLRGELQLSIYALAARESWDLEVSRIAYHYLLDGRKVHVPRDCADLEWVQETVLEVGEAIRAERFDPTPSEAACSVCDYRIVCPAAEP